MKWVVGLLGVLMFFPLGCGEDPCSKSNKKKLECVKSLDCSVITDSAVKQQCETQKTTLQTLLDPNRKKSLPCVEDFADEANKVLQCELNTTIKADSTSSDLAKLCNCKS